MDLSGNAFCWFTILISFCFSLVKLQKLTPFAFINCCQQPRPPDSYMATAQRIFIEKLNSAVAESFLRRSLEAIFDIEHHILAKSGQIALASEYKLIAIDLVKMNIISDDLK
jgi:hypothetical protein